MTPEFVSVILPVFNGGQYLSVAIESILRQDYPHFELILINDGSTDHSWDIIEQYLSQDSRIRAHTQDNCGLPCSLARGIELAKGDFIARMDQDDISLPNRLSVQSRYLSSQLELGLIGSSYKVINENGFYLGTRHQLLHPFHVRRHLFTGNPFCHGSVMFRKQVVLDAGNYKKDAILEDLDLWLRMMPLTAMSNTPEILYEYRVNVSSSLVARNREKYVQETKRLLDALWNGSSPDLLNNHSPKEPFSKGAFLTSDSYNRSRQRLLNQVGVSIIQKRIQRGDKQVAFREWRELLRRNIRSVPEFSRVASSIGWFK